MSGQRRALHLVRTRKLPADLAGVAAPDALVFLDGVPEGALPAAGLHVLGAAVGGASPLDFDDLAALVFSFDVVVTW
jgi:hypothetical protein